MSSRVNRDGAAVRGLNRHRWVKTAEQLEPRRLLSSVTGVEHGGVCTCPYCGYNRILAGDFSLTPRVDVPLTVETSAAESDFVPPAMPVSASNPVQRVRVLVLNYEPTVPSEGNQTLWQIFGWNDPRDLATGFISDMEWASGGAIDYEIVEWRDLNEFPIFTDGFRYTPDQYVENRRTNSGWVSSTADFYAMAEQQNLAPLVNDDVIDEIWTFGDHFFALYGEAWMAGPGSFFINGPSFPDLAVDRAVAGFGFSYERGVAEMLHNHGHRTENHGSRAYGGWNIGNPATNWDRFTANVGQTNLTSFGIGSCHYPFNGVSDYDYANPQTVLSYADDFVFNYPNQTYAAVPMSRDAWGDLGIGDWHRGYQRWFFGHLPRADGAGPDGRQNNWYKYIYDFNSYRPNTGVKRDNEAILGAAPLSVAGGSHYEFTLRFYDVQGINPATLDGNDVLVTGPGGFSQLASLVSTGAEDATTAGTARTVRYRITAPGGSWDSTDAGNYTVTLRANQVRDLASNWLPSANLGTFRVEIAAAGIYDINAMIAAGQASVSATTWDIGGPSSVFDGNVSSLYRSQNINPAAITLQFAQPQTVSGFRAYFSHAGGNPAYQWTVTAADNLIDLNAGMGSYRVLVNPTNTAGDVFSTVQLSTSATVNVVRLTAQRLTGDNYVHINEWQLFGPVTPDTANPTASLLAGVEPTLGANSTPLVVRYADDRSIDIRTINFGDVHVSGPNGFTQSAAFYGLDVNANGSVRDATYVIAAPGGTWDSSDNGLYTVTLVGGQVFDLAGKPVTGGVLGTFEVDFPPPEQRPLADLAELNAASWAAWADGAQASVHDDTTTKVRGQASIRFETNGGFDTHLRYAPARGAAWDLTGADLFRFGVRAVNTNVGAFQEAPIVRFVDVDGDARVFRYYRNGSPYPRWNDAIGSWINEAISFRSLAQPSTGWRGSDEGTPDFTRLRTVQIHADTWGAGFTLWLDAVGFNLRLNVESTAYDFDASLPAVQTRFDQDVGASLSVSDFILRNRTLNTIVPSSQLTLSYDALIRTANLRPATGLLADGAYELTLPAGSVFDLGNNTLASDYLAEFHVLAGDVNRDRSVGFADLLIVAQNYGQSGRTYSQGNFDYDPTGEVGFSDLLILAQRYGTSLIRTEPKPSVFGSRSIGRRGLFEAEEAVIV